MIKALGRLMGRFSLWLGAMGICILVVGLNFSDSIVEIFVGMHIILALIMTTKNFLGGISLEEGHPFKNLGNAYVSLFKSLAPMVRPICALVASMILTNLFSQFSFKTTYLVASALVCLIPSPKKKEPA